MSPLYDRRLNMYESLVLLARSGLSSTESMKFQILSGARLLFTFAVTRIDPATTVNFRILNGFAAEQPFETLLNPSTGAISITKMVLTDFNNLFEVQAEAVGGTADVAVNVMVFDNAGTTRIDNAIIRVDVDHTVDATGHFDSLRIGDGADLLGINPDGSINVNIQQPAYLTAKVVYNEQPAVPSGTETIVTTYTVPSGKKAWLQKIVFSGENIAKFKVYIDADVINSRRVHYGNGFSGEFIYNGTTHDGVSLNAGQVVRIKALHERSVSGNFEASIHIVETV